MADNWRHKLNETTFDLLSRQEQSELLAAMEQDLELRKKVISEVRFDNVLKENLRTQHDPKYVEQLHQTWSVDRVKREMQLMGLNPKELTEPKKSRSMLWLAGMGTLILSIVVFFQNSPQREKLALNPDLKKVQYQGQGVKVMRAGKEVVATDHLRVGDAVETSVEGWAHINFGKGFFIELGKQVKLEYKESDAQTELNLIQGGLIATISHHHAELLLKLGTPLLFVKGSGFKLKLRHLPAGSEIDMIEGRAELILKSNAEKMQLKAGEQWSVSAQGEVKKIEEIEDLLDKDLVGWWSMDDGQGLTIDDFSGRGLNGSLSDHVKLTAGRSGQALMISEINRKNLVIPHSPKLNIHAIYGITMMAWIKTTRKEVATILDKRYGEGVNNAYSGYQMVLVNGELILQIGDGNKSMLRINGPKIDVADGKWHHVCASLIRGAVQKGEFYIDGEKQNEFDCSHVGDVSSPAALNIGGHVDKDSHAFIGHIDEVRIYGRGLSKDEIKLVMNRSN